MKKLNKQTKISECLKELFEDSTIHGIPRVIKTQTLFMKLFWAVCFLGATSFCVYLVVNTVFDYLEYGYTSNVDTYSEMPASFPTVTICDLNFFHTNDSINEANSYLKNFNFLPNRIKYFILKNNFLSMNESIRKANSFSLKDSLIDCEFNSISCTAEEFERIFHVLHGGCYQFNSGKYYNGSSRDLLKITNSGTFYGLKLELFIGNLDNTAEVVRNSGFIVMINNQTSKPSLDGYEIATGIMTNINVNRLYTYRLEYPFNDCMNNLDAIDSFDSDLYRAIINSNVTYKRIDCFYLCYQKQIIETCNCHLQYFAKLNSKIPCLSVGDIICAFQVWNTFLKDSNKKCSSMICPTECNSITYSITSSFSDYPTKTYAETELMNIPFIKENYFNKSISFDQLKKNVLSVNIYYDQMSYVVISQQAKTTLLDLISNIGGLLGLFLGFSFLSFIEFVEAIFEVFKIALSSKLKKNNLIEVKEIN